MTVVDEKFAHAPWHFARARRSVFVDIRQAIRRAVHAAEGRGEPNAACFEFRLFCRPDGTESGFPMGVGALGERRSLTRRETPPLMMRCGAARSNLVDVHAHGDARDGD